MHRRTLVLALLAAAHGALARQGTVASLPTVNRARSPGGRQMEQGSRST